MNKKVIALAVAGALALPLAAKAQTANVTMYGTFRATLESTDLKDIGRNNHIDAWSSLRVKRSNPESCAHSWIASLRSQ